MGEWSWNFFLIKKWVDGPSAGVHLGTCKICFSVVKEGGEVDNSGLYLPFMIKVWISFPGVQHGMLGAVTGRVIFI